MRATVLLTLASVCFTSLASAWSPAGKNSFLKKEKSQTPRQQRPEPIEPDH